MMAIEEMLDLEQLEVNIYRGRVFSPESGNWQRTFGGHVAGQSLVSAVRTVDDRYLVHSLHGYFLRPGDPEAPIVFLVDRQLGKVPGTASQQQVWFRHRDPLPDDPVLHICALAYMSDLTLLGSAQVNHPEDRDHLQVASLDHAMWFMRPFRADEWLLYDQSSPSACGGRALTQGKIFNRYGEMVAAVMQEGLTRYQRNYTPARE